MHSHKFPVVLYMQVQYTCKVLGITATVKSEILQVYDGLHSQTN